MDSSVDGVLDGRFERDGSVGRLGFAGIFDGVSMLFGALGRTSTLFGALEGRLLLTLCNGCIEGLALSVGRNDGPDEAMKEGMRDSSRVRFTDGGTEGIILLLVGRSVGDSDVSLGAFNRIDDGDIETSIPFFPFEDLLPFLLLPFF